VLDLAEEVLRIAMEGELWPGYDPSAYPLTIYDGENAYQCKNTWFYHLLYLGILPAIGISNG
jgi:hypothetical protein